MARVGGGMKRERVYNSVCGTNEKAVTEGKGGSREGSGRGSGREG